MEWHNDFESEDELFAFLKEHADSIDRIFWPTSDDARVVVKGKSHGPIGGVLQLCTGKTRIISQQQATRLKADGIMERLRIETVEGLPRST